MAIGLIPLSITFQFPLKKFTFGTRFGVHDNLHPNGHRGADYQAPNGTPLHAAGWGRVVRKSWSSCLGNYVIVKHRVKTGKTTWKYVFISYNHMQKASHIALNANVKRGQVIGYVGNTGSCTTGAHCHVTLSKTIDGNIWDAVQDPTDFIEAHQNAPAIWL